MTDGAAAASGVGRGGGGTWSGGSRELVVFRWDRKESREKEKEDSDRKSE